MLLRAIFDRRTTNPIREALVGVLPAFRSILGLSFFINVVALAGPIYMMQVYDRVLSSRNETTLFFLTTLVLGFVAAQATLDTMRSRILHRLGIAFDQQVGERTFRAVHQAMLRRRQAGGATPVQALRDVEMLRDNLTGQSVSMAADLCWAPVFLAACFLLSPFLGVAVVVIMAIIAVLGFIAQTHGGAPTLRASVANLHAGEFAGSMLRNSEAIHALGMIRPLQARWKRIRDAGLGWTAQAVESGSWPSASLLFIRTAASPLVLCVAALLVLERMMTAGAMVGALFIAARAISPAAGLAGGWKSYVLARQAFDRLDKLFAQEEAAPELMDLPTPRGEVTFEDVTLVAPGSGQEVLRQVSFHLPAGEVLGVIGPSGAGKSSVARAMVGVWPAKAGAVRLDGADIAHWDPDRLGPHLGYVPQDVELFAGTVAQNIARFGEIEPQAVVAAARMAGVHDLIQALPDGYNTEIGEGGVKLSGGQRQRIALARAVLGSPSLVVMDEPNASLDTRGEESLVEVIRQLKRAGSTVVLITHRASILSQVDKVLVLSQGGVHLYGERDEVLRQLATPNVVPLANRKA